MRILKWIMSSLILISCNKQKVDQSPKPEKPNASSQSTAQEFETDRETGLSKDFALIKTVHGNIKIKFFTEKAPNTIIRIVHLIKIGFYNNLVFHRVVPNFVAQTGDPGGTGRGGSGKYLKAEFNDIKHERGIVGMARAQDINSADSQFYICLGSAPHLDEKYTVFGKVVEGMEFVDQIKQGDKMLEVTFHPASK